MGKKLPPRCGKTLVLAQGAPPVILLPGGGTFDVPVTTYFDLIGFPAGSGVCPAGPYLIDIDLTVTCTPAGDGSGAITGAPIVFGYNDFDVTVTVPAGPPRVCTVSGTATVALSDGMVLEAVSDSVACLAEPAPGDPSLPRLDMVLTAGSPISKVHPGDQSTHTYRITNNDPSESFSGTLNAEMLNSSRLPMMSGPMSPGSDSYSISDPGLGDNFPIGLPSDLIDGCLPLPLDPTAPVVPTLLEPILLPPGAFVDIDIFARPWGMCADGSCGRAKLVLDGIFSDGSTGIACSGFVSAADISVPPTFLWPDGGQTGIFIVRGDPFAGVLTVFGQPLQGFNAQMDLRMQPPAVLIDGNLPLLEPPQLLAGQFDEERGRVRARFQDGEGLFAADSFFDIAYQIDFAPSAEPPIEVELVALSLVSGAPVGFENTSPFAVGKIGLKPVGDLDFLGFGQLTFQMSGSAVDENGESRDLIFDDVALMPRPDGLGFEVRLVGSVAPGTGNQVVELEINADPRMFFSEQFEIPEIFTDGFESGNTSAWSNTVP